MYKIAFILYLGKLSSWIYNLIMSKSKDTAIVFIIWSVRLKISMLIILMKDEMFVEKLQMQTLLKW